MVCSCASGYFLADDGKSCISTGRGHQAMEIGAVRPWRQRATAMGTDVACSGGTCKGRSFQEMEDESWDLQFKHKSFRFERRSVRSWDKKLLSLRTLTEVAGTVASYLAKVAERR